MHSDPSAFSQISNATDGSGMFMIGFVSRWNRGMTMYGTSCNANRTSPNTQKPKY